MQRIVSGFDGSPTAVAALRWATDEARLRGVGLVVVTVVDDRLSEEGVGLVREEVSSTTGPLTLGVPTVHRIERGHAASRLVEACSPSDLLVIGSHGRGALLGAILGSVCRSALHAAHGPVAVVRDEPQTPRGVVLVGLDGSPGSRAALAVASEEARLRGASLQVVHAVHWDNVGEEWITPTDDDLREWGQALLDQELDGFTGAAGAEVLHGRAADVLSERSRDADLLVLGSRGRSPLTSLLLGSTAEDCARRAACPVLVVRGS